MRWLACVTWRILSNLRAIEKQDGRYKERQSREEPGRETTVFVASPLCVFAFKLLKPPSYAGYALVLRNSYVSCSYLVELMFRLELEVDFSFDRSDTTGFKCSYLPGLLTRKSVVSVDCLFRLVQKICHSTQLYLKLLLRIQHEVPFINTSEATKWSSDQTENGNCINVTNRKNIIVRLDRQEIR